MWWIKLFAWICLISEVTLFVFVQDVKIRNIGSWSSLGGKPASSTSTKPVQKSQAAMQSFEQFKKQKQEKEARVTNSSEIEK